MTTDPQQQQAQPQQQNAAQERQGTGKDEDARHAGTDGLKDKKPEELTPDELRLMADTMPGEGPGD